MHLKHAIFLEREAVDWLERKMHDGAGRVGLLQCLFRRCEGGIHAWIVDDKRTAAFVVDQLRRTSLQILLGYMRGLRCAPFDLHQIRGAARRHEAFGINHDPARRGAGRVIECQAFDIAGHRLGRGIVDRDDRAAVACGRHLGTGVDHAVHRRIDAVARLAVDLSRNVERRRISTDQKPFGRRLYRHVLQLVGCIGSVQIAACDDIAIGD